MRRKNLYAKRASSSNANNRILRTLGFVNLFGLLVWSTVSTASQLRVVRGPDHKLIARVETIQVGEHNHVSLLPLLQALSIPYTRSQEKKQVTLEAGGNRITLTALNPYLRLNNEIRQLPLNVLYRNGDFFIPLRFVLKCLGDDFPVPARYDEKTNELLVIRGAENILSTSIDEKENGLLIRVSLAEPIPAGNIFTSESNGWLYVDFYGGRIDTLTAFPVYGEARTVRDVVPIQLSNETARISYRIVSSIQEKNVFAQADPPQAVLSLRTRETVPQDLLDELAKEREKWKIDVIVIDPGHGGRDPGAVSPNGLREKDVTLSIARFVKQELENRLDVRVVLTRDRDRFVPLEKRTRISNEQGGKLFISIHADANPVRRLRGHTIFFMGPAKTEQARRAAQFENSVIRFEESQNHYQDLSDASFILAANAQNAYNKESQDLADLINRQFSAAAGSKSLGVKQAGFYVLYGASMPNILIETGFLTNPSDEKKLRDRGYQRALARAVCDAVIQFKKRYEAL